MTWIDGIRGPFTRVEVHDEQGLRDEEEDWKEAEGGAPNPDGK